MAFEIKALEAQEKVALIFAYYSLTLLIVGTLCNLLTLLIFCRSAFGNAKNRPVLYYMRVIAVLDILMLYGWNLDHYLRPIHDFTIVRLGVIPCKFMSFINYFTPQSSAWIRVSLCVDRYVSISRIHRTWFNSPKNVLILIGVCLGIFALINFHFFPFACYRNDEGNIDTNAHLYTIYPLWDNVNLFLYNIIPFVVMAIFNSGIIYHLFYVRRYSQLNHSQIQHRSISIILTITTCLFCIMTTPATIAFSFFYSTVDYTILQMLDAILTTYHVLSFPLYLITFREFRQQFFSLFTCSSSISQVTPSSNDIPSIAAVVPYKRHM